MWLAILDISVTFRLIIGFAFFPVFLLTLMST